MPGFAPPLLEESVSLVVEPIEGVKIDVIVSAQVADEAHTEAPLEAIDPPKAVAPLRKLSFQHILILVGDTP